MKFCRSQAPSHIHSVLKETDLICKKVVGVEKKIKLVCHWRQTIRATRRSWPILKQSRRAACWIFLTKCFLGSEFIAARCTPFYYIGQNIVYLLKERNQRRTCSNICYSKMNHLDVINGTLDLNQVVEEFQAKVNLTLKDICIRIYVYITYSNITT